MKRALLVAVLCAVPAWGADSVLVAVGTTATPMPANKAPLRKAVVIENNSAADIWCMYGAPGSNAAPTITIGVGHRVIAGQWRSFTGDTVWCAASVAQAGTGTDVTTVSEIN